LLRLDVIVVFSSGLLFIPCTLLSALHKYSFASQICSAEFASCSVHPFIFTKMERDSQARNEISHSRRRLAAEAELTAKGAVSMKARGRRLLYRLFAAERLRRAQLLALKITRRVSLRAAPLNVFELSDRH
jgi:hypothetical protein